MKVEEFALNGYQVVPSFLTGTKLTDLRRVVEESFPIQPYEQASHWWVDNQRPPDFMAEAEVRVQEAAAEFLDPISFHTQLSVMGAHAYGFDLHVDFGSKTYVNMFPRFQLLAGLALTDMTEERAGNLVLYPGSHLLVSQHFEKSQREGLEFKEAVRFLPPNVFDRMKESLPLLAKAGDLILAHSLIGHASQQNKRSCRRDMLYFRMGKPWGSDRSDANLYRHVSNPWEGWRIHP